MNTELTVLDIALRLGLAAAAGMIVGLERESHGRAAGMRTTMLACVAAALAMILSEYLFYNVPAGVNNWRPDPARLAAGVLTGMGFLGGGTIIREGTLVRGVTTAATLWFVTIVGLAFGSGHLWLGVTSFLLAMLVLLALPPVEKLMLNDWYGSATVTAAMEGVSEEELAAHIEAMNVSVKKIDLDYDLERRERQIHFELKYKKNDLQKTLSQRVTRDLAALPGVRRVKFA